MTKRILPVLLTMLVLAILVPLRTFADEAQSSANHTAKLISDLGETSFGVGDAVTVKIMVEGINASVKTYSAYDFQITYDKDLLSLDTGKAADRDAKITADDGKIRIKGYGADKGVSTPAVTMIFRCVKPGNAAVTLTEAKVDLSDNAGYYNAPKVDIAEDSDMVTIPVDGYEVQVDGEGIKLPGGVYVAHAGKDFIFVLQDYERYEYEDLEVTVGDDDITTAVRVNKKTGTCTIPGRLIDGMIRISVKRLPKTFVVTVSGSDITAAKTAEYLTDFVFRLDREPDHLYTVTIEIDGEEYKGYSLKNDVYTIPGTDVTGRIRIKVIRIEDPNASASVSFAGCGYRDGAGEKKTKRGVEYPFQIRRKKGFTYSLEVYGNGRQIPYEYDYELDTYYIAPEYVYGDITIKIDKYATVDAKEYITLDKQSIFLIVYNGHVDEGQVPRYEGRSMYWSARYDAYVWLVVSSASETKVKKEAEAKITLTDGEAAGKVSYSGNVNMTMHTDLADAKLVLEMYKGKYSLNLAEMQKMLNADVNCDRKVNVRDAAAIIKKIS